MKDITIEFAEKHGSGKTSVANQLSEMLDLPYRYGNIRYEVGNGRLHQKWLRVKSVYRHPFLVLLGLRARLQGRSNNNILSATMLAARTSDRMRSAGPGIYDEGPRHRLASVLMRSGRDDAGSWAKRIGPVLPNPDVIVWVKCDPFVAQRRFDERNRKGDSAMPLRPEEYVIEQSKRYDEVVGSLLNGVVIEVDSSLSSPEELALEIEEALCRY